MIVSRLCVTPGHVATPLLVRDPSGTRLTPAGAAFYDRIRGVLHAVDEAASTGR